jgi:hypothetical protein
MTMEETTNEAKADGTQREWIVLQGNVLRFGGSEAPRDEDEIVPRPRLVLEKTGAACTSTLTINVSPVLAKRFGRRLYRLGHGESLLVWVQVRGVETTVRTGRPGRPPKRMTPDWSEVYTLVKVDA